MNPRCLRLVTLCFALSVSGLSAADLDLGEPTERTPYDRYLEPMWSVLHSVGGSHPDLATVEQWVAEGRGFRYVFKKNEPYIPQTPDETEATKSGDCKAKALWLAHKIDSSRVRFVVGKAKAVSNMNHAWLIWEGPEGWLILDATMYSRPLEPQVLSPSEFIPTYSYAPDGKYAHTVAAAARGEKFGDHM